MQTSTTQREHMILGQLSPNEITDGRILEAMAEIPREPFLPERLRGTAYADEDMEIAPGRYMLAPLTLAKLITLAGVTPGCRVLNIGCLTGYSAAVLSRLGAHVVATDSDASTIALAQGHMRRLGIANVNPQAVQAMSDGYPMAAPYDAIVIQGGIGYIPDALGAQAAEGGRLVAMRHIFARADGREGSGRGMCATRIGSGWHSRDYFDAGCVLLPGFEAKQDFVF